MHIRVLMYMSVHAYKSANVHECTCIFERTGTTCVCTMTVI